MPIFFNVLLNGAVSYTLFLGGIQEYLFFPRYDYRCVSTAQAQYWRASPAVCYHAGKLDTSDVKRVSIELPSTLERMSNENLP